MPKVRLFVPAKVKLLPKVTALLLVNVRGLPVVLSIVPPLIVNAPVPRAVALLILSVPALSVVPPL